MKKQTCRHFENGPHKGVLVVQFLEKTDAEIAEIEAGNFDEYDQFPTCVFFPALNEYVYVPEDWLAE